MRETVPWGCDDTVLTQTARTAMTSALMHNCHSRILAPYARIDNDIKYHIEFHNYLIHSLRNSDEQQLCIRVSTRQLFSDHHNLWCLCHSSWTYICRCRDPCSLHDGLQQVTLDARTRGGAEDGRRGFEQQHIERATESVRCGDGNWAIK